MGLLKTVRSAIQSVGSDENSGPFSTLERSLNYKFNEKNFLREALTHPSFDSRKTSFRNNQRLEFLGDSVVGCILTKWLFEKFPDSTEGELSRHKSLLARGDTLAFIARKINLQTHLIIGKSEHLSKGNLRQSVLEDAFEALIGAIYLDSNYDTVEAVILQWEQFFLSTLKEKNPEFNPKGKLQEFMQSQADKPRISYHLVNQSGPDHRKKFIVELRLDGAKISRGSGNSKKKAEEQAALLAMKSLSSSKK